LNGAILIASTLSISANRCQNEKDKGRPPAGYLSRKQARALLDEILVGARQQAQRHPVARLRFEQVAGGLLGHWACWTRSAVELLEECRGCRRASTVPASLLARGGQITDCNAAFFDVAHGFAGCVPGIHEILRRQGLLAGIWCLDPQEQLSPGQAEEIDRVCRAYPHLSDDAFVREHLDEWLR